MKYILIEHNFESYNSMHTESELIALAQEFVPDVDTIYRAIHYFEHRGFTVLPLDNYTDKDIIGIQAKNLEKGVPMHRTYKCLVCGKYHYSDYELRGSCYDVYSHDSHLGTVCEKCFKDSKNEKDLAKKLHKVVGNLPIEFDNYNEYE